MNRFEKIATALLVVIAVEGAYSAWQIRRIAREGFSMELTIEQADTLARKVSKAAQAAYEDIMSEEGEL